MARNSLYNSRKKSVPFKPDNSLKLTPKPSVNALNPDVAPPADPYSDYWGQKVGLGKMPLDQFVRMAGMTAGAIAPDTASGRMGNQLATMGGQAYGERTRREYDAPNRLLAQKLFRGRLAGVEADVAGIPMKQRKLAADVADVEGTSERAVLQNRLLQAQIDKAKAPKTVTTTESERDYTAYLKQFESGRFGIPTRSDGTAFTKLEFDNHLDKMKEATKVKKPTGKQLMEVEGEILASVRLEENRAAVEWFNKNSKKNYTYEWQDTEQEVDDWLSAVLPGSTTETVKQWTRVPKAVTTKVDIKAERIAAKEAIDSGDFDEVKIKQQFESITGQAY